MHMHYTYKFKKKNSITNDLYAFRKHLHLVFTWSWFLNLRMREKKYPFFMVWIHNAINTTKGEKIRTQTKNQKKKKIHTENETVVAQMCMNFIASSLLLSLSRSTKIASHLNGPMDKHVCLRINTYHILIAQHCSTTKRSSSTEFIETMMRATYFPIDTLCKLLSEIRSNINCKERIVIAHQCVQLLD